MNSQSITGHILRSLAAGVLAAIIYFIIALATGQTIGKSNIIGPALVIGLITAVVAFIISMVIHYIIVANRRSRSGL